MSRMKIALIAGGYSGELEVSLKSQAGLLKFMEDTPYDLFPVVITRQKWMVTYDHEDYVIDKSDFSFTDRYGNHIKFDFAYITIHGDPGENGRLAGYFEMLQISHSTCSNLIGALTFNKYICNRYLSTYGIETTTSIPLTKDSPINIEAIVEKLGLPAFVKPNDGGSSLASTKVCQIEELLPAIETAFNEGEEVLVERFISGTEVTCGCYRDQQGIHVLPITEVISKNSFFDFDAKYNGEVEEITPARISSSLTEEIKALTKAIYQHLNASGIIRVDYIIHDEHPVLLEVNTTPGMTATSFIPQQVAAAGLMMKDVLSAIIDFNLRSSF